MTGTSMVVEIYTNRVEISNPGEPIVPVERFIDSNQSRNEDLAKSMRRLGLCEERSSGIDKVVQEAEFYQLPAPNFGTGFQRTIVTVYGQQDFKNMNRNDRARACYQHCVLKWVMSQSMTNQSLRKRFGLTKNISAIISQIIAATLKSGVIKLDKRAGDSRKFTSYIPFWA